MASGVGLGASGTGCLTESMEDTAPCFTLTDLLRQGLEEAPGWGMAEEATLLAGEGLLPLSGGTGAFSLIPGWEEAGPANGSAETGKREGNPDYTCGPALTAREGGPWFQSSSLSTQRAPPPTCVYPWSSFRIPL